MARKNAGTNLWRRLVKWAGFLAVFAHSSAFALIIEWDPNSETNLMGYRVYWGTTSRGYDSVLDVGNATMAQLPTPGVTTFYAVTAYDTDGLESDFSEEVSYVPPMPPVARGDSYNGHEDQLLTVSAANGVLANDTDANGDPLAIQLVSQPAHGTLNLQPNGAFTYMPATNFFGTDGFSYRVSDGQSTSAVANVTIQVQQYVPPPNQVPIARHDSYQATEDHLLAVNAGSGVLANDTDGNNDPLTILLVSQPAHGTLNLQPSGAFTYMPATNFFGADGFSYRVSDGKSTSAVANVTINVQQFIPPNALPVAVADSYQTKQNTPLTVGAAMGVLANDSDADGDTLSALLVSVPASGTLSLQGNGSFTYAPANNATGKVQFAYRASDGKATSAVATVTITIQAAPPAPITNETPVAVNDTYSTKPNRLLTVAASLGLLANDSDDDGDPLTVVLVASPTNGALTLNANGSFTYAPAKDFLGIDGFTYCATDSKSTSEVAMVTLRVENAPPPPPATNHVPAVWADAYAVQQGSILNVPGITGLLANDSDGDGDTLGVTGATMPAQGALSVQPNGSFSYTPPANFSGTVSFSYRATDGKSTSAVAVVTIVVQANAPGETSCENCLAELESLLAARGRSLHAILVSAPPPPTNGTCLEIVTTHFGTAARALQSGLDPQLSAALTRAADWCGAKTASIPPSRWTVSASNRVSAAWRVLQQFEANVSHTARAQLLATVLLLVERADRALIAGDLAPASLAGLDFQWTSPLNRNQPLRWVFGVDVFELHDGEGNRITGGSYQYDRTAWNRGTFLVLFDDPIFGFTLNDVLSTNFKFSRTGAKFSGHLRGTLRRVE
jgi:hypothetical protein